MRHLYNIIFLLAVFSFVSCTPEVDDTFDETAAVRIKKAIEEDLSILQGAKNGWMMEYYPSATRMYGGYSILVSFDKDGIAKVSCDLFPSDKEVKSQYQIRQSTGPTLVFDTYNEIFHFFSEPANSLGIGDSGKGMEGDYEFLILECTPEQVVLKGKKTGNRMVMTPIPEAESWKDYLGKIRGVARDASIVLYDVNVGSETQYTVKQEYHLFVLTHADGSEETIPFVYTSDGIKFYEPITIGSSQVQSLKWDDASQAFKSEDIALKAQTPPDGYRRYDDFLGSYVFIYENGQGMVEVTLEEELFNTSYTMKGFPSNLRVVYKPDKGVVGIETQVISGNSMLCPTDGRYFYQAAGAGYIGVNDVNSAGAPVVLWQDNGALGVSLAGLYAVDMTGPSLIYDIMYPVGMVKQ